MDRQELLKELETIQKRRFHLAMADIWDDSDYDLDNELWKKEIAIQNELEVQA